MWKDYLSFSKSERIAFWSLSIVFMFCLSLVILANNYTPKESEEQEEVNKQICAYFKQLNDSIEDIEKNELPITQMKLDLNNTNVSDLQKVGFTKFQSSNIIAFSKRGGVFRKISDVMKIYGMDSITYEKVVANIVVGVVENRITPTQLKPSRQDRLDKSEYIVELNSADTAILALLPGIGRAFSNRIVKFRESIGGYYAKEQLLEVFGVDTILLAKISPHLSIDTLLLKPLNINELSIARMKNHPYLTFYQAKDIYECRKKEGRFNNIDQVFEFVSFQNCNKELIRRYFCVK